MKKSPNSPATSCKRKTGQSATVIQAKPGYDPKTITAGVLHIGLGNFALAHLCDIVHGILHDPSNKKWGIVAASLRSGAMLNALRKHDHVYTLVEKKGNHRHAKLMAPIVNTIYAPEDPSKLVEQIADPSIKLVTMTISVDGYCLKGGHLDRNNAHIVHDMTDPTVPQTVYYYLAKGLELRRQRSGAPLTIMSLDNVQSNSWQLRQALLDYIELTNPSLVEWVDESCDFPVTLVDRITPEVKDEFRSEVKQLLGFDPGIVIGTEKFWQLVCERSRFEMPPLEQFGVKVVDSCANYWPWKYFMLNAVHQVLGMISLRLGIETIDHAMAHPKLSALAKVAHEQFRVFLAGEDHELATYSDVILDRLADSSMNDSVVRVVKGTTKKVSERVLSTVELSMAADGTLPTATIFTAACWLHNLGGCDEFAQPLGHEDSEGTRLAELYLDFREQLEVQLRYDEFEDRHKHSLQLVQRFLEAAATTLGDARFARLAALESFVKEFTHWVLAIEEHGVETALGLLLEDQQSKAA
jgi:mannitol 2-dehydrogenase